MSMRWWAVYRGGEYIEHVLAASGERALDAVSERTGIPVEELDAVDHEAMERSGLGLLPYFSMEIGPEFSEPVPTMRAVPWAQAEARVEARRDPIPDGGPTDADLRGEVEHDERAKCCGTCKWWIQHPSRGGVCFGDDSTRQASEVCQCWTRDRATQEESSDD